MSYQVQMVCIQVQQLMYGVQMSFLFVEIGGETRIIKQQGVYAITAFFCIFAQLVKDFRRPGRGSCKLHGNFGAEVCVVAFHRRFHLPRRETWLWDVCHVVHLRRKSSKNRNDLVYVDCHFFSTNSFEAPQIFMCVVPRIELWEGLVTFLYFPVFASWQPN